MSLQIFEKHPDMNAYKVGASFTPYAIMAVDNRFSDAELAAEYWAMTWELGLKRLTSQQARINEQAATLWRFAQHAHFDEVF